jgi:hypothetical protein
MTADYYPGLPAVKTRFLIDSHNHEPTRLTEWLCANCLNSNNPVQSEIDNRLLKMTDKKPIF